MKILVLHASSNAGRAVVQSLGAAGHRCCAAATSTEGSVFASRYAAWRAVHPDPLANKEAYQSWVLSEQRREGFDLILPVTEETLVPLHEIRHDPALAGHLAIPSAEAVEGAFDKEALRRRAESVGIAVPETVFVERLEALETPLLDVWMAEAPVVVKTTRSKVWQGRVGRSHAVHMARDRTELRRRVAELLRETPVQVQRWVPGRGVGIEVLARHGEIVMAFSHERIHEVPLSGGASSYRRSIAPPRPLLDATAALMRAYRWHGVAMVEFRVAEDRHWLLEVNGRFWGSLPLAIFAGADFPRALVDLLCHDRVPVGPPPATNVYARNVASDLVWIKAVLLDRRSGPGRLTRRLLPGLLEWTRLASGRETWDGLSLRDPGPILRELTSCAGHELAAVQRRLGRALLLREARRLGATARRRLERARRVLVVCHGNICRSPYAAARLSTRAPALEVRSRGLHAEDGSRTPEHIRSAAQARGVDLSAHRAAGVTARDLAWADAIVLMDGSNHARLGAMDERSLDKVLWLGAFDGGHRVEIEDPYDAPPAQVRAVLARIDACVESFSHALPPAAVR